MIALGPHAAFIVWAYVGVLAALLVLTALTWRGARRSRHRLSALEASTGRSKGPTRS